MLRTELVHPTSGEGQRENQLIEPIPGPLLALAVN